MDASAIQSNNIEHELKHPGTGVKLGIVIDLKPSDDEEFKQANIAFLERSRAAERRGEPLSVEEMRDAGIQLTAIRCADIRFISKEASWKGGQPSFSKELAIEMLSTTWIRKQIDRKMQAEEAFFAE